MTHLQEFTLTVEEVLKACEEYIRNTSGTVTERDHRVGAKLLQLKEDDAKQVAVKMSFGQGFSK